VRAIHETGGRILVVKTSVQKCLQKDSLTRYLGRVSDHYFLLRLFGRGETALVKLGSRGG